jgi:hypothetical protein
MSDGEIHFLHDPILELLCQVTVGRIVLGHHHDAGGIFIETMNNARSQHTIDPGKILAVIHQGIDQCPCRIPCSRMDDHPSRFVNHDDG